MGMFDPQNSGIMDRPSTIKSDFRIVRLTEGDARSDTDHIQMFRGLVETNEDMYPGIRSWMREKVLPGLRSSERIAYICYEDGRPVVSAVVKRGRSSKFCHLRIQEDFQDRHLGDVFFSAMALEVRGVAEEIHFTLPESLWEQKRRFFNSFGFHEATRAGTQYRLFDTELRCSAPFSAVWAATLRKLPKIMNKFTTGGFSGGEDALLMSIRSQHARAILAGTKRVEIRRRFSRKWEGKRITIYSSSPEQSLVGEASISRVASDTPGAIWDEFGSSIGCSRAEFDNYTKSSTKVYALVLDDVRPFKLPIPRTQVSHLLGSDLTPPQSYCTLEEGKPWAQAVSLAALLHATFKGSMVLDPKSVFPHLSSLSSMESERSEVSLRSKSKSGRPHATQQINLCL